MSKEEWISEKIAKLIEEGYEKDQAVAIANSMWEKRHEAGEKGKEKSSEKLGIPTLTIGKTKLTDKQGKVIEITPDIYKQVLSSYDPDKIHRAPIVEGDHDDANLPPLGWVNSLSTKKVGDREWITMDDIEIIDPKLKEKFKQFKFNSPELEIELYDPARTKHFPKGAEGQYYLRRVNIVPLPAQFGMPSAKLSDGLDFSVIRLCDMPAPYYPPSSSWCSSCGRAFDDNHKFCPYDGTELEHKKNPNEELEKEELIEMGEKEKEKVTPPPLPDAEKKQEPGKVDLIALSERLSSLELLVKAEHDRAEKAEIKLAETEKRFAELASNDRSKDLKHEVENYVKDGDVKVCVANHLYNALRLSDSVGQKIKLSETDKDGKVVETELSLSDAIRFIAKNGGGVSPGELKVVSQKASALSLSDKRQKKIEDVAAKLKLDLSKVEENMKAQGIAISEDPELFHPRAGGE